MTDNTSRYHIGSRRVEVDPSRGCIVPWCITIGFVIGGLLTLFLFVTMGGVFAFVGPWLIVIGALLVARRLRY